MSSVFHPSCVIWGTCQIECLSYEACCDSFQHTRQESQAVVVICEASKASVVCVLLGGGRGVGLGVGNVEGNPSSRFGVIVC